MVILVLTAVKDWLAKNNKFGAFIWKELAKDLGLGAEQFEKKDNYFTPEQFEKLITLICKKISMAREAFDDSFTKYWAEEMNQKFCRYFLTHSENLKIYIKNIIKLNSQVRDYFPNSSNIWMIDLQEIDDKTLQLNYSSEKVLAEFIKAVAEGKAQFFNTPVSINKTKMFTAEIKL
jgi:hypothetical protein